MRTLLIGILSATLIGCACPIPPYAMLESCTSQGCFDRTAAASPPIELKPAPLTPKPATKKGKSTTATKKVRPPSVAAKTAKPSSVQPNDWSGLVKEKVDSSIIMKPEVATSSRTSESPNTALKNAKTITAANMDDPAPARPSETSDPVVRKAKITIAAKMEDPASVEFDNMKRAMRKNTFGQLVDTICGNVKAKKTSGENTGEKPFLYLVKEDEAYVVDGNAESAAAIAYRNICISTDFPGKDSR